MTETYIGNELEIFAHALRWKAYFSSFLAPYGKKVLEVGAGIGATTAILCDGSQEEWLCLEPDLELLAQVEEQIRCGTLPSCCRVHAGTVRNLEPEALFDSILYIDVLEHIEDDRAELEQAARHLAIGGRLMVLSPAYPFLYSPFDEAIGHYRRYTRASFTALTPQGCKQDKLLYLDSVGLFTSLANRLLLRQSLPTHAQILFWDRKLVPLSKFFDRITGFNVGRSIVAIWKWANNQP
jgi:ubiquinone/menaquinone biosynthesis C-methylase UbiE